MCLRAAAGIGLLAIIFAASAAEAQTSASEAATIGELELLAGEGDPLASYRLGKIYAEGKGVEQSDLKALIWLRCAAQAKGTQSVQTATSGKQAEIEARAGRVVAGLGWALAEVLCSSDKGWTSPYSPTREDVPAKVFFLPGDMFLTASLYLSHALDLSWMKDAVLISYRDFGNIGVGIASLGLWFLIIKGIIAVANSSDHKSRAWMRAPPKARSARALKEKKDKAKDERRKREDSAAG